MMSLSGTLVGNTGRGVSAVSANRVWWVRVPHAAQRGTPFSQVCAASELALPGNPGACSQAVALLGGPWALCVLGCP